MIFDKQYSFNIFIFVTYIILIVKNLTPTYIHSVPIQIATEQRAFCIKCSDPEQLSKIKLTIN